MVYDSSTGELRDDRKHLSMLEDFWLPRREGGKGTEITTLPPGQNLGELADVQYFQKKLLQSLGVPYSRLNAEQGMVGLGRTTEVTRDELKFAKFITRIRNKFSQIFDHAFSTQLVLKGVCSKEEWEKFREEIYYDYKKDNNFQELKDSELLRERINMLGMIDPFVGRYYSQEWVKKNVLQLTDDEIEEMEKQIESEPSPEDANAPEQDMQEEDSDMQEPNEEENIDNTYERGESESETPQLDADVERISKYINK
jgi:hypothetical protein